MADFIPKAAAKLKLWLQTFKARFAVHAPTLGIAPAEITATDNDVDLIIADIDDIAAKKAAQQNAVQKKKDDQALAEPRLRATIKRMKSHNLYTPAIGEDMDIIGEGDGPDPATYKPEISGQAYKGYNQINFKKGFDVIDGMHIYGRLVGTASWGPKLAYDTNSPYPHYGVTQGQAWEYMAIAVIDDVEFGLPSETVEITAI
jgi:hypothetical protein